MIRCRMDARAASAIPADCDRKVFARPALKTQLTIDCLLRRRFRGENAKYFRADQTRTTRRDRNRHAAGWDRVCETCLAKEVGTSVRKIDRHIGGFAITSRTRRVKSRDSF